MGDKCQYCGLEHVGLSTHDRVKPCIEALGKQLEFIERRMNIALERGATERMTELKEYEHLPSDPPSKPRQDGCTCHQALYIRV
jgi:hypothetical protein